MTLVYLDQNVWTKLRDRKLRLASPGLENRLCVSSTTIDEVVRSGNRAFLREFERAGAIYVDLARNGFELTDTLTINDAPDWNAIYLEAVETNTLFRRVVDASESVLLKLYGGALGIGLASALEVGLDQAADLVKLPRVAFTPLRWMIRKVVPEEPGTMADFQRHFGIDRRTLGSVPPSEIFEKFEELATRHRGVTPDEMVAAARRAMQNGSRTQYSDVHDLFFALGAFGYKADKFHVRRKLSASLRDARHVAMASYLDRFISDDDRCVLRAMAVYDRLNIETEVLGSDEAEDLEPMQRD